MQREVDEGMVCVEWERCKLAPQLMWRDPSVHECVRVCVLKASHCLLEHP